MFNVHSAQLNCLWCYWISILNSRLFEFIVVDSMIFKFYLSFHRENGIQIQKRMIQLFWFLYYSIQWAYNRPKLNITQITIFALFKIQPAVCWFLETERAMSFIALFSLNLMECCDNLNYSFIFPIAKGTLIRL